MQPTAHVCAHTPTHALRCFPTAACTRTYIYDADAACPPVLVTGASASPPRSDRKRAVECEDLRVGRDLAHLERREELDVLRASRS